MIQIEDIHIQEFRGIRFRADGSGVEVFRGNILVRQSVLRDGARCL